MIIKASALREGRLVEVARAVREQGKGAIYVASEILAQKAGVIRRELAHPEPAGAARPRGRPLRAHRRAASARGSRPGATAG